jgi:hypothetical protein
MARLSGAIAISRVICVLGVVYVHAWTGLGGMQLVEADATGQGAMRWALMELLGRSAVPLLGMISGWLVAGSACSRPYGRFLNGKARTILLPLLLWNMLAMLIVSGGAWLGWLLAPAPRSIGEALNQLLCLVSPNEVNVQMAFLRDLFICMALAPLLARLPAKWLALAGVVAAGWAISGLMFPLLLRPAILLFFIFGILARRGRWELRAAGAPLGLTAVVFGVCALVKAGLSAWAAPVGMAHPHLMAAFDLVLRIAAALFFWRVAWDLAGRGGGALLQRLEPYAFLIFSAHLIMIWLGGPLIGSVTGPLGSPLYPAFLLLQPLMVAAVGVALGRVLMTVAPQAAWLLSGGRLRDERPSGQRENGWKMEQRITALGRGSKLRRFP